MLLLLSLFMLSLLLVIFFDVFNVTLYFPIASLCIRLGVILISFFFSFSYFVFIFYINVLFYIYFLLSIMCLVLYF